MKTLDKQAEMVADELLDSGLSLGECRWSVVYAIVLRHMEEALADAKAEEERVWEETLRLIHRKRG